MFNQVMFQTQYMTPVSTPISLHQTHILYLPTIGTTMTKQFYHCKMERTISTTFFSPIFMFVMICSIFKLGVDGIMKNFYSSNKHCCTLVRRNAIYQHLSSVFTLFCQGICLDLLIMLFTR